MDFYMHWAVTIARRVTQPFPEVKLLNDIALVQVPKFEFFKFIFL
jgi:hypothetical protein